MSVTICYPTPNANVPGGGGFFVWGQVSGGDTVTGAQASWGTNPPQIVPGVVAPAPTPQCNWAFMLAGVATGPDITVNVQPGTGDPVPVTFQCVAHAK
jgi:hypothetical protein